MHGQITSNKKGAHIMKTIRNLLIISSAMLLSLPAICSAEQPKAGPYVSGFIGVSIPRDSSVTTDDYNTPATYQDEVEFDPGINIGGTGGYDFGKYHTGTPRSARSLIRTVSNIAGRTEIWAWRLL